MTLQTGPETVGSALSAVLTHLTTLVRKEIQLAKAEMGEQVNRGAVGIALMVVAVVMLLIALNVLAGAAVAGLVAAGLTLTWASVAVALAFLLIMLIAGLRGRAMLKTVKLVPSDTVGALATDFETLKETFHDA